MDLRRAWDRQYKAHGTLWRGERPLVLGDLPREARILELGCGNGKGLVPLLDEGRNVVGLDFSRSAIHGLRRASAARERPPVLVAADAVQCPFRDATFDAVLNHHVLPHLLEAGREALLRECARVLVPGGLMSVEAFGVDDLRFGKGDEVEPGTFRRGTGIVVHHFGPRELRDAVAATGFRVVSEAAAVRPKTYGGRKLQRSVLTLVARKEG